MVKKGFLYELHKTTAYAPPQALSAADMRGYILWLCRFLFILLR